MQKPSLYILFIIFLLLSCTRENTPGGGQVENPNQPVNDSIYGFGILKHLKGIWNGPVTSSTALGNYPEWIVDFRPISSTQISAKNELDTLNDIHLSFFVAKYNNTYAVAFRNGGSFNGMTRVSYFLADSISETGNQSYYRFSEILKGKNRAYSEVIRKQDSLLIFSYTNKSNSLNQAVLHMSWRAKLQDTTAAVAATSEFGFPTHSAGRDLSQSFQGVTESIYYNASSEPYPESEQPYLGRCSVHVGFAPNLLPVASKKVFVLLSTQPLISGFSLNFGNLKFRSRYVILDASSPNYTFNYMHPGTYYVYALYDNDGSSGFSSGDWVSATNLSVDLTNQGSINTNVLINFTLP